MHPTSILNNCRAIVLCHACQIKCLQVQQKLKTDTYDDIEELSADMDLLVNNAKAFYKPDSIEYKDADQLWKLYEQTRVVMESGKFLVIN